MCSGCGSEYISCGTVSLLLNVICVPGGTVKFLGLAPVAVIVTVVPPDGDGDDVESLEQPPAQANAATPANRVVR